MAQGTESLLQPKRVQGPPAKMPDAVLRARVQKTPVKRPLVLRRAPDLVAEIPGEAHASDPARNRAEVHGPNIHEPERFAGDILPGEARKHRSGIGPGDREACIGETPRVQVGLGHGRVLLQEPAHVIRLRGAGTHNEETIATEIGGREIADQATIPVEHRRQRHPPRLRNAARQDTVEPVAGTLADDLVFRKTGNLGNADPFPHRAAFCAHMLEIRGPAEGQHVPYAFGAYHRGVSTPAAAPITAPASRSKSYAGVVRNGRAAGNSSLG